MQYSLISKVDDELEIKAYYAGHVLGAAMVQIKVGAESVVYTVSTKSNLTKYRQIKNKNNSFIKFVMDTF